MDSMLTWRSASTIDFGPTETRASRSKPSAFPPNGPANLGQSVGERFDPFKVVYTGRLQAPTPAKPNGTQRGKVPKFQAPYRPSSLRFTKAVWVWDGEYHKRYHLQNSGRSSMKHFRNLEKKVSNNGSKIDQREANDNFHPTNGFTMEIHMLRIWPEPRRKWSKPWWFRSQRIVRFHEKTEQKVDLILFFFRRSCFYRLQLRCWYMLICFIS